MKSSMKILRKLPEPPRPATRATFKKEVIGDGKYTRTVDKPPKLHMTPGKWPRSAPKRRAKKQAATNQPHKATVRRLENTKKVLELYDKGYTTDQIECEMGLSRTTINRYIRKKYGKRYRPRFLHDAKIIELYESGMRVDKIGEQLDVPTYYVDSVLKRLHANREVGRRYKEWKRKSSE